MADKPVENSHESVSETVASRGGEGSPGFVRRYRLPLFLALVALCLYAGSILYILFGRGQVV